MIGITIGIPSLTWPRYRAQSLLRRMKDDPAKQRVKSVEDGYLERGLAALEKRTGKKSLSKIPEWMITSYDVEIGPFPLSLFVCPSNKLDIPSV